MMLLQKQSSLAPTYAFGLLFDCHDVGCFLVIGDGDAVG